MGKSPQASPKKPPSVARGSCQLELPSARPITFEFLNLRRNGNRR
jgi:hypothetical protein